MRNRTLVLIVIALAAGYLVLRSGGLGIKGLPWNQGQAGTIFQPGHYGGGQ